jgi:general nucleoside transport system permease protein
METGLLRTLGVETLRMTVPYGAAALGGIWSEKSGVVNIALEGMLLTGALSAVVFELGTGSTVLAVLGAAALGGLIGAAHGWLVTRGVDAIVSGIAWNLVAMGGTRFVMRALYGSSSNSPAIAPSLPPAALMAIVALAVASSIHVFAHTRFGLQVRAAGQDAAAAASLGLNVAWIRVRAVATGGCVAGFGGAALAFDEHQFQSGMSGGRGFIALAAVIVSGYRPGRAVLVCALFALLDAGQIVLQGEARVSHDVLTAAPYLVVLLSLAWLGRRRRRAGASPAALASW